LGVFYSPDVASKKNDLLDALVQLDMDQKILDEAKIHREAVPNVFMITYERAVRGDRNSITRALNNLKLWDIPQEEIDALLDEAKKICSDKEAWTKTPEGRWASWHKLVNGSVTRNPTKEEENPWGRVTLRADRDGVIVERTVGKGEMVVDNTVNLFQIADVSRLQVIVNCPEDDLPKLEALGPNERKWTVQTVGANSSAGLSGTIDVIGWLIDPNQHTAVITGYVENPGERMRGGQYCTATVNIPPPDDVVEIPVDALYDDGKQSVVFIQPDAAKLQFTMRRVQVTHRFDRTVFVRKTPIPKEEQLTAIEAEEGLLPKQPVQPGERILEAGVVELKRVVVDLESRHEEKPADRLAKERAGAASGSEARDEHKLKGGKG
jgi:cobalt-zinc-cadmium efflux system membrane fusion protein